MSLTPEEAEAVLKDIETGIKSVIQNLRGFEAAFPIAIARLHPKATSTRKLLHAAAILLEARQEFESVLKFGMVVRKDLTKKLTPPNVQNNGDENA